MFQWIKDKLPHPVQWIKDTVPHPTIPNPIPEPVWVIIGSSYFWLILWLTATNVIGSKLLGKSFGGYVGVAAGGALWYVLISKSSIGLLLIVVMFSLPICGSFLNRNGLFRSLRGVKICPDCAEEVKKLAKVCKHCTHHF